MAEAPPDLVYQPELKMAVGETYDVIAKLPLAGAGPVVIPGPPTTVVDLPIRIYCRVSARLRARADEFYSSPALEEWIPQSFIATDILTWKWRVSPKKTGPNLKLTLELQSQSPEEVPGDLKDYDALINVKAVPESLPSRLWEPISDFFGTQVMQYLLLPSGGGVLTAWLVRRWNHGAR